MKTKKYCEIEEMTKLAMKYCEVKKIKIDERESLNQIIFNKYKGEE